MHKSVLLNESIENLKLSNDSIIVDCTLGYAGHSSEILKRIPKGFLYAFDQDETAIASSRNRLQKIGSNFEIIKSNFVNLKNELNRREITRVDGVLFDLGVSSPQLDEAERGFSFHQDAVLDMRMDKDRQISAKDVVNSYDYISLVRIFRDYGEEKYASSIAKGIIAAREEKEIVTTLELVDIIKNSVPIKYRRDHHPARKVFQAIRIEVNDELNVFSSALRQALDLIEVGGRICVITFHSLEDRICKNIFNEVSKLDKNLAKLPVVPLEYQPGYRIVGNVSPSDSEILENNRSRSARLRVIEKIR